MTLSVMVFGDVVLQRDEHFSMWQGGATESTVQQTSGHQLVHYQSLFFVSHVGKPAFVSDCLVDEIPKDVIKLLHVFCTITFTDLLISAAHARLRSGVLL